MCNCDVKLVNVSGRNGGHYFVRQDGARYHFPAFTVVTPAILNNYANNSLPLRSRHTNFAKLLRSLLSLSWLLVCGSCTSSIQKTVVDKDTYHEIMRRQHLLGTTQNPLTSIRASDSDRPCCTKKFHAYHRALHRIVVVPG